MRIVGRLLASVLAIVASQGLITFWVLDAVFPLDAAQGAALRGSALPSLIAEGVALALAIGWLARPVDAALRSLQGSEPGALLGERRAHALCGWTGGLLGGGTLAAGGAMVATLRERGLPSDLTVAAAAVALAMALLATMLGCSAASASVARALEQLGARAGPSTGATVRSKILAVGFGLDTIAVLLLSSTAYVQYRADFDREYVAAAARAHQAAIAQFPSPDPRLAAHAFAATGAPSALIGTDGEFIARYGKVDAPIERALRAHQAVTRAEQGFIVASAGPAGTFLSSWLPDEPLEERRRNFLFAVVSMAAFVYVATALAIWFTARTITAPFRALGRAAERIASGDLTANPPSVSRDELGRLAADFRRMTQGLRALVVDVQGASGAVSTGAREAAAIGERVRSGAVGEHAGIVAVQGAVEDMQSSMLQVSQGIGGLTDYAATTNRAMAEIAAALEEVSKKGAELESAMSAAIVDVEQLGRAGSDAQMRLGALDSLAGHAENTVTAAKASMTGLERAAAESETTAELVAQMAEHAGGVVEETVHGIESLRAAVADAHRRVSVLGHRSDDIDQVVDFISEVAGRTNLLSLNASIIAAQAGEHGKPFGVVADQIRELAAQIARSTKSIGDIIHAVREDVEATAAFIERGDALASDGVRLARGSLAALSEIRRSSVHARDTASGIRVAVDDQARSTGEVAKLVESVADGSKAVAGAVLLVSRSVTAVNSASRSVNGVADQLARALQDQAGLGRRQIGSVARLEQMIAEIGRAAEAHDVANRRVREAIRDLTETAGQHETAVEGLAALAERIGSGARALAERVDRFKVQ